jgi:hypothetical protein
MALNYTTTGANILKTVYLPAMSKLLDDGTPLLKMIEKKITPTEGNNFKFAIHRGRNVASGVGRAEGAALPTPGEQGHVQATVPFKSLYSSIEVTGQVMAAARSNKGSFVRALDNEMQRSMVDTKRSLNRQVNGDGTGALFYTVGTDQATPADFDDGFGNVVNRAIYGAEVATLDLIDASDHTTVLTSARAFTRGADGAGVTSFSWTGGVLSGSVAADDYLIYTDSARSEMVGIQGIISNANPLTLSGGLHGLPVASYADWVAQILGSDSSRQDLTFNLIQQLLSRITSESAIDQRDIKILHCHQSIADTYAELCRNERVFHNTVELDGGFEAIAYSGIPVVPDVQCRRNALYAITPSSLSIAQMAPLEWIEEDGAVLFRVPGNGTTYDKYGATARVYQEVLCHARNQNGAILGLNDNWA